MKKKKQLLLMTTMLVFVVVLSACGTSEISASSTGVWEKIVYLFAQAVKGLSIGGSR